MNNNKLWKLVFDYQNCRMTGMQLNLNFTLGLRKTLHWCSLLHHLDAQLSHKSLLHQQDLAPPASEVQPFHQDQ